MENRVWRSFHRKSQLRKEEHQQKLDSTGYQAMRKQLNQMSFLPPLDADNTKANIYYIKKRFMKFCWSCNQNKCRQWKFAIKTSNCDKGLIISFLHWICETYVKSRRKRSKKKTINQYWRDFKMLYRRANKGKLINSNDCQEVTKFNLDDLPKSKPVMGVDDLLWGLTHHWARDRSVFPTEDDRLDVPTIMLFQAYSAYPLREEAGKLGPTGNNDDSILFDDDDDDDDGYDGSVFGDDDDGSGYDSASTDDTKINDDAIADANDHQEEAEKWAQQEADNQETEPVRLHKALCYEDLTLWIVKDPKNGGRDVLVMEVYLRYHKGANNKAKPTVFLFREHPLLMLCPISHILARAIRDDAIQVNGYSSAEPFFSTKLGKGAVKVHWKPCKLKTPVFRKSVRTASGAWKKSETEPMKYATYAFYLDRIGIDLGSEEKWTVEPMIKHYLQERTQLQGILCDFNRNLSLQDITDRKVRGINLMVSLASRREIRRPTPTLVDDTQGIVDSPGESDSKSSTVDKGEEIRLVLEKTQHRTRKFSRISHMMDHVEKVHLRREPARATWIFLTSLDHFKNHVLRVHRVKLRK
ncbi:FluG domain-containing protein [Dactylonectria estremocensis]|uniref:FluG domain-containing protein n=1 Tax=Dactylonectria estremocensis TaxID=1079267 RepID=A0A9P9FEX8_9HYPO|nr:FluG domain-containing protein [Dactylonectria estremocensis]